MGDRLDPTTGELRPVPDPYSEAAHALVPIGHPPDLKVALERWKDDRAYVKRFLREYLEESEYTERGSPITGRMHDYYRLPGKDDYRPTAVGAEKVALFFGLFKGATDITVLSESKEHVSMKARVSLVDAQGRVRGSAEKVISSAEATFRDALTKKWGGDARAGLNDLASRAVKRAYVEAVTITCALGELFNEIAREQAGQRVSAGPPARPAPKRADPKLDARGLPTVMPVGTHAGERLTTLTTEFLLMAREACRGRAHYNTLAEAIGEILEQRRAAAEGASG